jgi:hypothetical protein
MSTSKNSTQLVCYYEYEDQPQAQLNSVNKRNSFLRRSSKNKPLNNGIGTEQAMPLLSLSPTASSNHPG